MNHDETTLGAAIDAELEDVASAADPLDLCDALNRLLDLLEIGHKLSPFWRGQQISSVVDLGALPSWLPATTGPAADLPGVLSHGLVEFDQVVLIRAHSDRLDNWRRPVASGRFCLVAPDVALTEDALNLGLAMGDFSGEVTS